MNVPSFLEFLQEHLLRQFSRLPSFGLGFGLKHAIVNTSFGARPKLKP